MGIIEGALVMLAGILIGRFLPGRRRALKTVEPECGCKHHYSMHDPETGRCHGTVTGKPIKFDAFNDPTAYEQAPCTCRRYTGPEPLPTYVATEIAS